MALHESKEELVPQIWLLLWMDGEHGAKTGGRKVMEIRSNF